MRIKMKPVYSLIVLAMLVSCAPAPAASSELQKTLTPMSAAVEATITERAALEAGGANSLATAQAHATQQAEWIYATQTARASLNEPSRLATSTAIAPVVAELPLYGIDPAEGYVAWIHDPITMELEGFRQSDFASDYPGTTAADFVIVSDITWNTFNSLGGCGYLFRSDGDDVKPTQYTILMERVATGQVVFGATYEGELSNYHKRYPKNEDPSFDWANDATNRLALVVRGNLIDVYTNGIFIGQFDITKEPPVYSASEVEEDLSISISPGRRSQLGAAVEENEEDIDQASVMLDEVRRNFSENQPFFYDGFLSFLAVSDTGQASCTFEESWLFILTD